MKTVKWKRFWIWDYEKEEQWLNEMAAKGLVLDDVKWGMRYFLRRAGPESTGSDWSSLRRYTQMRKAKTISILWKRREPNLCAVYFARSISARKRLMESSSFSRTTLLGSNN
ncbi:MAG TPA: DUF2812 domain-containing protein [Clostridiaceae bacterium]|nr:DUF2812 domain-containing protein [Clostridiaceae bacterium]